ncbi:hypothetical protein CS369_03875 [Candidatus Symbiopectobacterium sp. 'North America']|nr:hypothetical protein [Candidatus Symbiopectobacterium sp. 'North America']
MILQFASALLHTLAQIAHLSMFIRILSLAARLKIELFKVYPSYFKLQVCWLHSLTRITYLSK